MSLTPKQIPEGAIRYNTDSNKMEVWIGDKWMIVSTSSPNLDGGVRALFSGRSTSPGNYVNTVDFITVSTQGNATDFGDQNGAGTYGSTTSDKTRGIIAGGHPQHNDVIDFCTISTTANFQDFGDLTSSRWIMGGGVSSGTRSVFAGGSIVTSGNPTTNVLDYVTTQSLGNAKDFGDCIQARRGTASVNNPTRGIFAGGYHPATLYNLIEYITTASTGNAADFGDLRSSISRNAGCCNAIRGMFGGGGNPEVNSIEFINIATFGNAVDYGDLLATNNGYIGAAASPIRGVFAGGNTTTASNVIQHISLQTAGNSVDFGDLTVAGYGVHGLSNGHGGL